MTDPHESLTPVSRTAVGMALVRAEENRRPDQLFDDPYAEVFVGAAPDAFADDGQETVDPELLSAVFEVFSFHGIVRTRFFDDYLVAACASGCRQMVLLGAGLDTRAYRLPWPPETALFELDQPELLAFKDGVLAGQGAVPCCARTAVPADLRENWKTELVAAGFDPDAHTAWLAEGLLIYLSYDESANLLGAIGDMSVPGSQLAIEHGSIADAALFAHSEDLAGMDEFASLWRGGLGENTIDWLARNGWQAQLHDTAALAASYDRPVPAHARGGFITAVRQPRSGTYAGATTTPTTPGPT